MGKYRSDETPIEYEFNGLGLQTFSFKPKYRAQEFLLCDGSGLRDGMSDEFCAFEDDYSDAKQADDKLDYDDVIVSDDHDYGYKFGGYAFFAVRRGW